MLTSTGKQNDYDIIMTSFMNNYFQCTLYCFTYVLYSLVLLSIKTLHSSVSPVIMAQYMYFLVKIWIKISHQSMKQFTTVTKLGITVTNEYCLVAYLLTTLAIKELYLFLYLVNFDLFY